MSSRIRLVAITGGLMLAGCARSAVELPPAGLSAQGATLTAEERQLSCAQVKEQMTALKAEEKQLEGKIRSNRSYNQTVGYALGAASVVIAEHNQAEKDRLDAIQRKKDRLIIVTREKQC